MSPYRKPAVGLVAPRPQRSIIVRLHALGEHGGPSRAQRAFATALACVALVVMPLVADIGPEWSTWLIFLSIAAKFAAVACAHIAAFEGWYVARGWRRMRAGRRWHREQMGATL